TSPGADVARSWQSRVQRWQVGCVGLLLVLRRKSRGAGAGFRLLQLQPRRLAHRRLEQRDLRISRIPTGGLASPRSVGKSEQMHAGVLSHARLWLRLERE